MHAAADKSSADVVGKTLQMKGQREPRFSRDLFLKTFLKGSPHTKQTRMVLLAGDALLS